MRSQILVPTLDLKPKFRPVLDPGFTPSVLWNRSFEEKVQAHPEAQELALALIRVDGSVSRLDTRVFPHRSPWEALNLRYVERLVKFFLWQKGGYRLLVGGDSAIAAALEGIYSERGERAFDYRFMGEQVSGRPMEVVRVPLQEVPGTEETKQRLGRHLKGCRVGFDLGGSDRKCAAVRDGEVVHTEEVVWDPYFNRDPRWHFEEINDTIRRAASKLPRVDSIGGSAAGIYVNNEVRAASLFRGVSPEDFATHVRRIFFRLQECWGNVPMVVVNDGEVTALAGSMALQANAVLGVAMGTSLAAGYVTPQGFLTNWLNELAFAPVDLRPDAPIDEWSGDRGVGAQYFSQQAVGRLLRPAGIELPEEMALPEKLVEVQRLMEKGQEGARRIYETLGVYFGYTLAYYARHYSMEHVLVLGRIMTGGGGDLILEVSRRVLQDEFPEVYEALQLSTPSEKERRHGQAVAAASLPALEGED